MPVSCWGWLALGYAMVTILLCQTAGIVAVFYKDPKQRTDAFRVFKLLWTTTTGTSGVVAIVLKLHEAGLL